MSASPCVPGTPVLNRADAPQVGFVVHGQATPTEPDDLSWQPVTVPHCGEARRCPDMLMTGMQAASAALGYLHSHADGPVPHVGSPRRLHWVVVHVDDLVQVPRHVARNLRQLLEVEEPAQDSEMLFACRQHPATWTLPGNSLATSQVPSVLQACLADIAKNPDCRVHETWPAKLRSGRSVTPLRAHLWGALMEPVSLTRSDATPRSRTNRGSAMDARLHTAVSSGLVYSRISVHRLLHLIVPCARWACLSHR